MKVQVDDHIAETAALIDERARHVLSDGAVRTQNDVQSRQPVETGFLRAGTKTRPTGPLEYEVYSDVDYAPYVEFGTGIYSPTGRKTQWTYYVPGRGFFTTRGMRPQPAWRPSYEKNRPEVISEMQVSMSRL